MRVWTWTHVISSLSRPEWEKSLVFSLELPDFPLGSAGICCFYIHGSHQVGGYMSSTSLIHQDYEWREKSTIVNVYCYAMLCLHVYHTVSLGGCWFDFSFLSEE